MKYESVILEMMTRIQKLEARCYALEGHGAQPEQKEAAAPAVPAEKRVPTKRKKESKHKYGKLTEDMVEACYQSACRLEQGGELNFADELAWLVEEYGINRNTAIMCVYAARSMLRGDSYNRAISRPATEHLFQDILRDFGEPGLQRAIQATRAHIEYRIGLGHHMDGLESLCRQYENR